MTDRNLADVAYQVPDELVMHLPPISSLWDWGWYPQMFPHVYEFVENGATAMQHIVKGLLPLHVSAVA